MFLGYFDCERIRSEGDRGGTEGDSRARRSVRVIIWTCVSQRLIRGCQKRRALGLEGIGARYKPEPYSFLPRDSRTVGRCSSVVKLICRAYHFHYTSAR